MSADLLTFDQFWAMVQSTEAIKPAPATGDQAKSEQKKKEFGTMLKRSSLLLIDNLMRLTPKKPEKKDGRTRPRDSGHNQNARRGKKH